MLASGAAVSSVYAMPETARSKEANLDSGYEDADEEKGVSLHDEQEHPSEEQAGEVVSGVDWCGMESLQNTLVAESY